MDTTSIFERDPAITRAETEYQEALRKFLANEMTLDECLTYQLAVFDACNKNKKPFRLA